MNTSNATPRRSAFAALMAALKSALQWKLLVLWLLATLLPTWLAAWPMRGTLQSLFGDSMYGTDIAAGKNVLMLIQGIMKLSDQLNPAPTVVGAALVMLLLAPWLTGMIVASLRAGRQLGFGELVHGGIGEYWRMLRMLLWSLIPVGIAVGIGVAAAGAADKATEQAVLASDVDHAKYLALLVAGIVFVIAHASVEAGRGWLGADAGLRSVIRAWWRGFKLVLRRPVATLGVYLGSVIVGFGLALLLSLLRLKIDGVGGATALLSLLVTQLMVVALAWGRIARLYALSDLAGNAIVRKAYGKTTNEAPEGGMAAATA